MPVSFKRLKLIGFDKLLKKSKISQKLKSIPLLLFYKIDLILTITCLDNTPFIIDFFNLISFSVQYVINL